jgi:RimJ/RimL family protein N-acetyltransferase
MILKTARMTLRPQALTDAQALFAILGDADAMRFWGRPAISRLSLVEDLLGEQQAAMAQGLCRYWTMIRNGESIGSIDLSLIKGGSAEMGFLVRRDCWGDGLASEAVGAIVRHAFGPLALTRLAAVVQVANLAACRVLEKNGFRRIENRTVAIASGEKRECAFYLLSR